MEGVLIGLGCGSVDTFHVSHPSLAHSKELEVSTSSEPTRPVSFKYRGPVPYTRILGIGCHIPLDAMGHGAGHLTWGVALHSQSRLTLLLP